jgi:hypothetical protein
MNVEEATTMVPALDPDLLFEECPDCAHIDPSLDAYCLTCFDEGLVPHQCGEEADGR